MSKLLIKTNELIITEFDENMIECVHKNSLDEDNRKFVPDEVFETIEEAREVVLFLMKSYGNMDNPQVYPVLLKNKTNIGYVQLIPVDDSSWEIGYHIAQKYSGQGYATKAVNAFLSVIINRLSIKEIFGVCLAENIASCNVLEKTGFSLEYSGLGEYQGQTNNICRYKYFN